RQLEHSRERDVRRPVVAARVRLSRGLRRPLRGLSPAGHAEYAEFHRGALSGIRPLRAHRLAPVLHAVSADRVVRRLPPPRELRWIPASRWLRALAVGTSRAL